MKNKILEILKNSDRALSVFEIEDLLSLNGKEDLKLLLIVLNELEKESLIYHSNKDKYMLLENSHLKKGIMRANKKGFGFVSVDGMDEDIYISADNINGAIHDDIVLVEIISKKDLAKVEGRVLRVIKRELETFVGEVIFKKGICTIKLDDKKLNLDISIPKKNIKNIVNGHKVLVKLTNKLGKNRYNGEILKVLGHKDDPGVDILSIIYKYDIDTSFKEEVIKELESIPESVSEDEIKNRKDLRDEIIFTIDGKDTKDIDDAISIKKLDNGNFLLGVHIADVSYYVKENSALDKEAMERATSVYLVDRVIPMLPHELSNGICSLNPNVERLTISCIMEFDENGNQVDYEIFESVIKSRIQMTYENVNLILENGIICDGYDEYVPYLKLMEELSIILRKMKDRRGYLDFDVDEAKILVDETCHPKDIVLRERGVGEKLIEDFMIAANECVATHIFYMDLPFIYRVHDYPKEEKIREFLSFLGTIGYQLPLNIKDTSPKTIQKLLDFLKDKNEFKILSSLLLRNMKKAVYDPQNIGHYGLASSCYTHFTSPIRRYPDTTVHRLLRTYLFKGDISKQTISHWEEKLPYISEHSSSKERSSIECEREVEDMKMAEYMEDHIGEEFQGMISSVLNFGMFIQLPNMIEGLVPIASMDDYYHYDELTLSLIGEKTKKKYTIGEEVIVKVVKASKQEKIIDFEIVRKV